MTSMGAKEQAEACMQRFRPNEVRSCRSTRRRFDTAHCLTLSLAPAQATTIWLELAAAIEASTRG